MALRFIVEAFVVAHFDGNTVSTNFYSFIDCHFTFLSSLSFNYNYQFDVIGSVDLLFELTGENINVDTTKWRRQSIFH